MEKRINKSALPFLKFVSKCYTEGYLMKKQRFAITFGIFFLIASMLLLYACSGQNSRKKVSTNPDWSEYIGAHTSGTISKAQTIQLRFVNDVVSEDQLGQEVSKRITIEPTIDADIHFVNPREIQIKPNHWLNSDTRYTFSVNTEGLKDIPPKVKPYIFAVKTLPQNFEIEVEELKLDSKDPQQMRLSGRLTSADVAKTENIEALLKARYDDKDMSLQWEHDDDDMNHHFFIKNIARKTVDDSLLIRWNGDSLGVDNQGETKITIPAINKFSVTASKVVYGEKQYVEVQFSDNLKTPQLITDFIKLGSSKFTARIEGNVVKIYPRQSLKGKVQLQLGVGIENSKGDKLPKMYMKQLIFSSQKPQIKFSGSGVIIPENKFLNIPFEAMNVKSVQVTAFRIYENNIGQFLQSNKLDGYDGLERVGRYLWRKTIKLSGVEADRWNHFSLDATELLKKHPGALYRITLSINRGNAIYACSDKENQVPVVKESPYSNNDDYQAEERSGWDGIGEYYNEGVSVAWEDRNNPCKDSYYINSENTKQSRNFLASNIGLLAKRDKTGQMRVIATDIRSGEPMKDVSIEVFNFQNQVIKTLSTDKEGFAGYQDINTPFYLSAKTVDEKNQTQFGYLKLSAGSALPVSHFDVGGHKIQQGVKATIYGERGVWRPGDKIYLVFVVEDKNHILPKNHPVSMRLVNPSGQIVKTINNNKPVDNMYRFDFKTDDNAPTGKWQVQANLGGRIFSKHINIETVVPNRLKVDLDLGSDTLYSEQNPVKGSLFAQWLHGAKADGLEAKVQVNFTPTKTSFGLFNDFIFDDPTREYYVGDSDFVAGKLDSEGYFKFKKALEAGDGAPGMLHANFTSRVYEESGAFSISRSQFVYHPYKNYVGIKLPKGDQERGMLLTDTDHLVEIASLDAHGKKVSLDEVEVSIYKIHWKWWWDQTRDSLAQYSQSSAYTALQHSIIKTVNGRGKWTFNIKYPDWGRYLVRACDVQGKHCSAKVVYIDWPGWAGRAQEQSGPGASVLNVVTDKPEYKVGETAYLTLPKASQGRALLSLESGTRILQQRWLSVDPNKLQVPIKITPEMAPNVYADITLLQPHQHKNNDRPIRLYGISLLKVSDPATHLQPLIETADEWEPESKVEIVVSEKQGRAMNYTLAVVDEGLLGLTAFKTPDLHKEFYRREALGVQTWDLYDQVLNAYGGKLERVLALGGGADGDNKENRKEKRFPPVVKFFGPFHLDKGQKRQQSLKLPPYMGALRVMLVAAKDAAYGSDSKSVLVRQPLVILPTLPRLVGSDETISVPVSVFVSEPEIKQARITIKTNDYFEVVGDASATLTFDSPGDKIAFLSLRSKSKLGQGKIEISANAGKYLSKANVSLEVRASNPRTSRRTLYSLKPGETWETQLEPFGLENSNAFSLELSSLPPINLGARLQYLIHYPYGCLEQVTSSVFPQLFLAKILQLNEKQRAKIDNNIHAGIDRLRQFQYSDGSFKYWPGNGRYNDWANNYAGQFLIEASHLGYDVPQDMLSQWLSFQKSKSNHWVTGDQYVAQNQAYRLYTLALANQANMSAMNRLRENKSLDSLGRWYLGAAYKLAGQQTAAEELINSLSLEFPEQRNDSPNFASTLRDQAIALSALTLMGGRESQAGELAKQITHSLASDQWFSTQSLAFSLSAIATYMQGNAQDGENRVELSVGSKPTKLVSWNKPIYQQDVAAKTGQQTPLKLKNNSQRVVHVAVNSSGVPKAGDEVDRASGLRVTATYQDSKGNKVDLANLQQGKDISVIVTVINISTFDMENLALKHILPAGWEIHNDRLTGADSTTSAGPLAAQQGNNIYQYRDIRDDRVYTFFSLNQNEKKQFRVEINASYAGKYYLPAISVEDMYNDAIQARIKGQWISIVKP